MLLLEDYDSPPQLQLNQDDDLLRRAEQGEGEFLRLWECPRHFVVLGRTSSSLEDVDADAAQRGHLEVLRRSSGGGTVVQGPGCMNFALVLDRERDARLRSIADSYRAVLDRVSGVLLPLGVESEFRPVCDLVLKGTERKFSGNAQRRGRRYILHHGTILYAFDLPLISRYLHIPRRMPDYRKGRPHSDFVANLPVARAELLGALRTLVSFWR